jgi:hypothetical protein
MTGSRALVLRLSLGALVLGALALHASHKLERGVFAEMLWACHVASLLLGVGLVARVVWLVALGTVFHVAAGLPAYVLDVIALKQTTLTSVVVHLAPPLSGLFFLKQDAPWPRFVPVATVTLYPVLVVLSRLVTEPALNVNLAFSPWPPLARVAPWLWFTWLLNLVVLAAAVPVVDRVLRRSLHPTTETKLAHG